MPDNDITARNLISDLFSTVPAVNVQGPLFQAKGNGIADDTVAIQACNTYCTANNYTMFIPDGLYNVSVSLLITCSVIATPNAVIKATATMSWVVGVGSVSNQVKHKSWVGGVVASNRLANDGFFLRNFQHYDLVRAVSTDALINNFHIGDSGTAASSFEFHGDKLRSDYANDWWDSSLATGVIANSIGFYAENCTDSSLKTSEFINSQYGTRTKLSSWILDTVHNYPHGANFMHYAFWDEAISNTYINCHADTPSDKGFYFSSSIAAPKLLLPRFTINSVAITTAIGIYFNGLNNPQATIVGAQFGDASSGGAFAVDLDSTGTLDPTTICLTGTQYYPSGCVTTKNMSTNRYPISG